MSNAIALIVGDTDLEPSVRASLEQLGIRLVCAPAAVSRARAYSTLVTAALESDAERLLFLAADVVPTADDLARLVQSPKLGDWQAVSGCYLSAPKELAVYSEGEKVDLFGQARFVPMIFGEMGFAAVPRAPFEKLRADLHEWSDSGGARWVPFAEPVVLRHRVDGESLEERLTEDLALWWHLRRVGVGIWLDTHLVVARRLTALCSPSIDRAGNNFRTHTPEEADAGLVRERLKSGAVDASRGFTTIRDAEAALGFRLAHEPVVGALLRVLVASRPGARVLEIGTGVGRSTACLLDGLDPAGGLVTIDDDGVRGAIAKRLLGADPRVTFIADDARAVLSRLEPSSFDVIFADAPPGKFEERDRCLSLLKPGGIYVVDDLTPSAAWPAFRHDQVKELVDSLEARDDYKVVRLAWASGVLIAVRRS